MLISDFARANGLSRETVRFYVRLGLLRPTTSSKGGRRPYQLFTDEDRQAAEVIRVGQSLGLSLKEIAALDTERRENGIPPDRLTDILKAQLAGLEAKAGELDTMIRFVRAKIEWLAAGGHGPHPNLGRCGCDAAP
ncbi:UNVERIFIED_ORG: DNA-binding transcriptional MerR regulator [Paraburkholderia sediminicola]|jgi:MerR family transcriptional regulator, copper efflux regulator|uniref:DNA-binding transcriptional regulator, MerR family n=1 Tax=Paraburkholderia aspalathi TaxID=1324617 RepID=A0A1I7AKD5_9BURK|nr:MerR family transcriptional regulator [Paraburkholderia aspalathi]MCP2084894.1 DNA-binding transcriptional MerR regulator [Paraburkholderia sediminicola]SFT75373.1 DNA-binding transcriptional regulator, MerR family [Paraburkholderia aspalathi]